MNDLFFVSIYGGPLDGLDVTIPAHTSWKALAAGGVVEFEYEGVSGRYQLSLEESLIIYLGPALSR